MKPVRIRILLLVILGFAFLFGAMPRQTILAAAPSLGAATTYGILAGTYTNTSAATIVNGDIGFTTGPATVPLGTHTNYGSGAPTPTARTDAASALTTQLNPLACTFNFPGGPIDVSTDGPNGATGVYPPGVYCSTGSMNIGVGGITLSGSGDYLFRAVGALTSTAGAQVTLSGASACNVFWTPTAATTFGANTTFAGTIIDNANAITTGANTIWSGRAISLGAGTVTTGDTTSITVPTCSSPSATLTIVKTVTNDNGGTKVVADFPLFLDGGSVTSGVATVTTTGLHTISETTDSGYASTISGDCAADGTITLTDGQSKTCTIVNNDIGPILHVVKAVINDNGRVSNASSAIIHVKSAGTDVATSPHAGVSTPGFAYNLSAGTYTVSEESFPGYTTTYSGDCDAGGIISLAIGEEKTCTVTNNDNPRTSPTFTGTINVVKIVINDNGQTKTLSDFPLFVNDMSVASGATNTFPGSTNLYIVTETADEHYAATFSGGCDPDGVIYLHPDEHVFCVITNDDIGAPVVPAPVPPLINIVKIPSPLALPDGPGPVSYTFTVRNVGTVPITDVSVADDSCSPIMSPQGDTNSDGTLALDEAWTYTCITTLTETHTNTVVATGWANGLSTTDIAITTVVVGIPVVPPLIHVTKIPDPLTLPAGGGLVTYTETITNPGAIALSNVQLVDDKCAPVTYIDGDSNNDAMLDPDESWVYRCQSTLTQTTTNTARATGEANGFAIQDLAIATVVVAASTVPSMPNTGATSPFPFGLILSALGAVIAGTIILRRCPKNA